VWLHIAPLYSYFVKWVFYDYRIVKLEKRIRLKSEVRVSKPYTYMKRWQICTTDLR